MNESDEVDVDGEKVTIGELKKAWKRNKKANESDEDGKDKEDKKDNESDEDGKDKEDKKENSSDLNTNSADPKTIEKFELIKSLHENGVTYNLETEFLSTAERVALGRKHYGKK
jgi:hypothetical protein